MRSAATIAVAFVLILLQSLVLEFAPAPMVAPSLGLLVVLHVGLSPKWSASSSAVVGFCVGYLFDLVSGSPRGLHALVFILMALFARLLATRVAVRGFVLKGATSFVAAFVAALFIIVVRAVVSPEGGYGFRQVPFEALLTGFFGPPVLWLLARLDGKLDPARLRVGLARRRARPIGGTASPR